MKKIIFSTLLLILVFAGVGALANRTLQSTRNSSRSDSNNKLRVSASFYPLYFFTEEISGEKAEVTNITPSGAEPHDYDPSSQDIARIEKGNMLVINGGVESWAEKIKENLKGTKIKIIVAGEDLLTLQLTEDGKTIADPHVWLDPVLAKQEVLKITQGFVSLDPANASYYQANEKTLDEKLDAIDNLYQQGLSHCQQKEIITSHAAFGYLAARYGLHQVPIAGLSPDAEPSSQQLAEIVKFAKAHNTKYIFFESLISPKLAEAIATEVGAKTLVLDPLEGLSDDQIKQAKNYFTIMKQNLKNLQLALQCNS